MSAADQHLLSVQAMHEALLNLYNPSVLAECTLAQAIPELRRDPDPSQRAQRLRELLLDLVAQLRPVGAAGVSASASRAHESLTLRYVSGLEIDDVAEELSLSPRQVYRDLRWAEERLAELARLRYYEGDEETASSPDVITREAQALAIKPQEVSLAEVAQWVVTTLGSLATRFRCALRYAGPESGVFVSITPGILRETLAQLLSALVQSSPGGQVILQVSEVGTEAHATVPLPALQDLRRRDLLEAALHVAEAHHLHCAVLDGEQTPLLRLSLPLSRRRQLLVVEDNPGAMALYERYLSGTEWDMVAITDPRLTVEMALIRQAEAVVLDVMMPETDGWTVLQALRANPETAPLPVVICSVVDDLELGLSLGAAAYLTKPVSRADFLEALRRLDPRYSEA